MSMVKILNAIGRCCGKRKVGGLYIYCGGIGSICYRLPIPIPDACPCCGEQLRQLRSVRIINPKQLWGDCDKKATEHPCHTFKCRACFPPEKAGLMWVGKEYTPEQFIEEALKYGVSKRIPAIPKQLKIGDSLFLVHNNALSEKDENGVKRDSRTGLFFVATITEFQKIVNEKQAEDGEYIQSIVDQGITPVLELESDEELCEFRDVPSPQKTITSF
jgi:hypothetical protein